MPSTTRRFGGRSVFLMLRVSTALNSGCHPKVIHTLGAAAVTMGNLWAKTMKNGKRNYHYLDPIQIPVIL